MATVIFRPTSPTNQNRPIAKIFNFCVFYPIWMKLGMGANIGPETNQPKPTNSENFQLLRFSSDLDEIWYEG